MKRAPAISLLFIAMVTLVGCPTTPDFQYTLLPATGSTVDPAALTLTWTEADGATGYEVALVADGADIDAATPVAVETNAYTVPSELLEAGATYQWRVRATSGGSPLGVWSPTYLFVVAGDPADPGDPTDPTEPTPSFFWGRWVRMDGTNEEWYFSDTAVTIGEVEEAVTPVDDEHVTAGARTIRRQSDNMVAVDPDGEGDQLEYYLFRKAGANATMTAGVRAGGAAARAMSGLMGIEAIVKNLLNESNEVSSTTASDGKAQFTGVVPGDEYELTVPVQEGVPEEVTVRVRPEFDGDNVGFVTISEAEQNFKVSYRLSGGDELGYYYAGETYDLEIRITNIGTADMLSADYGVTVPEGLQITGDDLYNILGTVRADGGQKTLSYTVSAPAFAEDVREFTVPISIRSVDGRYTWDDQITLQFFRESMTIHVRSETNEVQGIVISPDRRSLPFKTSGFSGSITIPARETGYILALSGADYSSETRYALRVGQAPTTNGADLRTATAYEPNNDETQPAPAGVGRDYEAYLGVYDLDFYAIYNRFVAEDEVAWTGVTPGDGATVADATPTLSWNPILGATGYEVLVAGTEDALASASPVTATEAEYTPTEGLINHDDHWWQVRAVDADGATSAWSGAFSFTVEWGDLTGLAPEHGSMVETTTPSLDWNDVTGAAEYEVRIAGTEAALATMTDPTGTTTGSPYVPSEGLANNTTHWWQVRAKDEAGIYGEWSTPRSIAVSWAVIEASTPADGEVVTTTTPTFTWTTVADAAGYDIRIAASQEALGAMTTPTASPTTATYTPAGLANNTTHWWQVRAKDGGGIYGAWTSARSVVVTWGLITGMTPADGTTVADTTPTFTWDAVAGADGYEVQIVAEGTAFPDGAGTAATTNTYTPSAGLANNATHQWRVRATDTGGTPTAWSTPQSVVVAWGAVSGLTPADGATVSDPTPTLSWTAVTGAVGYEVRTGATAAAAQAATPVSVSGATSYDYPAELAEEAELHWQVRAKDAAGVYGEWSGVVMLTYVNSFLAADPHFTFQPVIASGSTGTFSMGSTTGESDEQPVHTVTLTRPYSIGTYEVTNDQYAAVMNEALDRGWITASTTTVQNASGNAQELLDVDSSYCRIDYNGSDLVVNSGYGDHPVTEVTWYGSVAFAYYLNAIEGREQTYDLSDWSVDYTKAGYRLPSEAEWEYAARGTDGRTYPWGNSIDGSYANYWASGDPYDSTSSPYNQNGGPTTPVGYYDGSTRGSFGTNDGRSPYGAHDMGGNVWEWANDWYGSYGSAAQTDPAGPASGSNRVRRGGSWYYYATRVRTAFRHSNAPSDSYYNVGFRLLLPAVQ